MGTTLAFLTSIGVKMQIKSRQQYNEKDHAMIAHEKHLW